MNAVLKVDACVMRPAYDNTNVARGAQWMTDNWESLRSYWSDLGGKSDDGRFFQFASVQWDRQRMGF